MAESWWRSRLHGSWSALDAPAQHKLFGVLARPVDVRIESPALHARLRVERDEYVRRGLEIEEAVRQHGCRLEREFVRTGETGSALSGAISPGQVQLRDIAAIDLRER